MARLDKDRQENLEHKRLEYAKSRIEGIGHAITYESDKEIRFMYKGKTVYFFPYSGWHTGQSIKDGRGIEKLLKQIL